jgi:signal transduction histidine kinase
MNRLARHAGLALVLLLLFVAALAGTQRWLERHNEKLRKETIETRRQQFEHTLGLARPGPLPWSPEFIRALEEAVGGRIVISSNRSAITPQQGPAAAKLPPPETAANTTITPDAPGNWFFEHQIRDETGSVAATAQVSFATPPTVRGIHIYRQSASALLWLALGLVLVFSMALLLGTRSSHAPADELESALPAAKAEMGSLTHLAKVSALQGVELARERGERLRAEEDLHFQQVLLNRALEEKIRLGHDLHDGIIQSLYATGLTLEAAKNLIEQNPAEAFRQLDASLKTLNSTIRDVRSYIVGLAPENLREQTFADSVRSLTQTLDAGREVAYDLRIDNAAATRLNDEHFTNLLQIVREAISNSLRHGQATQVVVRFHDNAGELCLLVQDNGKGFDATRAPRGHGLSNMRSRAERLGATLKCTSTPGSGTRIVLNVPVHTPSPASS